MFYIIEPEIAGVLGESTSLDTSTHPPVVTNLEFIIDSWLGDSIIESFPCFLVTKTLASNISDIGVTGYEFDSANVVVSEDYVDHRVPEFVWLKVNGKGGVDDFGLTEDLRLIVSQAVMDILNINGLDHAEIERY